MSQRRRSPRLLRGAAVSVTSSKVVCLTPTFGTTTTKAERLLAEAGANLTRVDPSDRVVRDRELTDAVAVIVGTSPFDRETMSRARMLRVIAKHGSGVDNIDLEAAAELGVIVTNAPHANSVAVAEFTIGLMLATARGIVDCDRRLRGGEWKLHIGRQLSGATVGIVGLGAIGRLVASRSRAFGMHVLYHDPVPAPAADDWERVALAHLLERSDFVTLHVPLLPETTGLIDHAALQRMRPTAFLINVSRGGVVDEAALARALSQGSIAGAALDVFSEEPLPARSPLAHEERAVLTPHTAAYTEEALAATSVSVSESIVAVLSGQAPTSIAR
jgi:D-3-phosphoglycerate dehydrogenase / 2-oxoglutarate reductase